ncbi:MULTISPECIES: hypothetical protein [unclassified Gemella]|uniref:hypothetical protein n=1 Tax=unclassified Gemella TaxID=2624949 RepID=UPI0014316FFE|nr:MULTISPECIES: hypothetical protein [unclassified Gemella]MBF0709716.1 hypothetical protein [Gemella sp. GL1.1]MBF0747233.1 hypothetical protein [Gemella sp. 19428wG2_WT2a]NYS27060.1 hypothetical protein [Gemella sp. GL1]
MLFVILFILVGIYMFCEFLLERRHNKYITKHMKKYISNTEILEDDYHLKS